LQENCDKAKEETEGLKTEDPKVKRQKTEERQRQPSVVFIQDLFIVSITQAHSLDHTMCFIH